MVDDVEKEEPHHLHPRQRNEGCAVQEQFNGLLFPLLGRNGVQALVYYVPKLGKVLGSNGGVLNFVYQGFIAYRLFQNDVQIYHVAEDVLHDFSN